jgi:hypothetical protein
MLVMSEASVRQGQPGNPEIATIPRLGVLRGRSRVPAEHRLSFRRGVGVVPGADRTRSLCNRWQSLEAEEGKSEAGTGAQVAPEAGMGFRAAEAPLGLGLRSRWT